MGAWFCFRAIAWGNSPLERAVPKTKIVCELPSWFECTYLHRLVPIAGAGVALYHQARPDPTVVFFLPGVATKNACNPFAARLYTVRLYRCISVASFERLWLQHTLSLRFVLHRLVVGCFSPDNAVR